MQIAILRQSRTFHQKQQSVQNEGRRLKEAASFFFAAPDRSTDTTEDCAQVNLSDLRVDSDKMTVERQISSSLVILFFVQFVPL